MTTFTDKSKSPQTQYGVDNKTIGDFLTNTSFGGARGLALAALIGEQFILAFQNLNTAQNYYNINVQDFNFFKSTYMGAVPATGRMNTALQEARTRPFYGPGGPPQYGSLDYLSNTGRGVASASYRLDREWLNTRRKINKYTVGQGRRVDYKYSMARYNAELEGWNLGFRYEDTRKQQYDEQRHAHQTEILNIGIGFGNSARAGLATAAGTLNDARSELANNVASVGNGLAMQGGYESSIKTFAGKKAGQQYGLATAGKNPVSSGGVSSIPDVTKGQLQRASGAA